MSVNDLTSIIFVAMFCIYLVGSFVTMIFAYINNKRLLDYLRHIIRMQEYEIIDKAEEVEQWGSKQSCGSSAV